MKNNKLFLLLGVLALFFTASCDDDDDDILGDWIEVDEFTGMGRSEGIGFMIDDAFYYGLGYNGKEDAFEVPSERYLLDFYSNDGGSQWVELAPFPGAQRKGAFSFSVDGKGYVGGGYFDDSYVDAIYFDDIYEYDPEANTWTLLPTTFTGGKIADATSFVVNNEAYVVGGRIDEDDHLKLCWKFDSASKSFVEAAQPSNKRSAGFSFVIDGIAYLGGGYSNNGAVEEFESYDAETDTWNDDLYDLYLSSSYTDDISHYDNPIDLRRYFASAFVLDGKGYICGGFTGSVLDDCWEYDPRTDLWTEMNDFESTMSSRYGATAFTFPSNQEVGYIVGGYTGSSYLDDVWTILPGEEADETN